MRNYRPKRGLDGLTRAERFDLNYEVLLLALEELGPEARGLHLDYREVGDLLGISYGRVEQILNGAFEKIRTAYPTRRHMLQ